MAAKAKAVPAVSVAPVGDVSAIMAMMQQIMAAQAAQAPKASPKAVVVAKGEKPKAAFSGGDLAKQLKGKDGVIEEKTQKGRVKMTAFCNDGSIVTVII